METGPADTCHRGVRDRANKRYKLKRQSAGWCEKIHRNKFVYSLKILHAGYE